MPCHDSDSSEYSCSSWSPTNPINPKWLKDLDSPTDVVKEKCKRFRVLVMGRRNAGKTTLLQRMTQSSDGKVLVSDPEGNPVDPSILEPSVERGHSHIEYEITYPSNPSFVFHDSRGMEAGSNEEVEKLVTFMAQRAQKKQLSERVHVIWYCLPVDNDRPLSHTEMQFFAKGTRDVPVIAIFTKFEWRITKAFQQLREEGAKLKVAKEKARERALLDFDQILQEREELKIHPPAGMVFLQEMDKKDADCSILTQRTWEVVENEVIQNLFALVQRNRVQVSMSIALIYAISLAKEKHMYVTRDRHRLDEWTALLLSLFPYWNNFFHMELHYEMHWNSAEGWTVHTVLIVFPILIFIAQPFFKLPESDQNIVRSVSRALVSGIEPGSSTELQLLNVFIDIIIIAESTFSHPTYHTTPWQNIAQITYAYLTSPSCEATLSPRKRVQLIVKQMYESEKLGTYYHVKRDKLKRMAMAWVPVLMNEAVVFRMDGS